MRIKESDYEDIRLGEYILSKIKGKIEKTPAIKKVKSGTLTTYYKNKVSDFVLKSVENGTIQWSDFSTNEHALRIINRLYDYLLAQT